ncbi:unnamed protein product [Caenorhabditis nigoni]
MVGNTISLQGATVTDFLRKGSVNFKDFKENIEDDRGLGRIWKEYGNELRGVSMIPATSRTSRTTSRMIMWEALDHSNRQPSLSRRSATAEPPPNRQDL